MTTTTIEKTATPNGLDARVLARVLEEGYGPGAWHGPDLRAALADVGPELARYELVSGEPLELLHYGEQLTLAEGEPQERAVPAPPTPEPVEPPAGRAPDGHGRRSP